MLVGWSGGTWQNKPRAWRYPSLLIAISSENPSLMIRGGFIVSPHADQVINLLALAIRHNLTARDLQTTMFAYPTGASNIVYML